LISTDQLFDVIKWWYWINFRRCCVFEGVGWLYLDNE